MKRVMHLVDDPRAPELTRIYALSHLIDIAIRSGRTDLAVTASKSMNECGNDRVHCLERIIDMLASELNINVVFTR